MFAHAPRSEKVCRQPAGLRDLRTQLLRSRKLEIGLAFVMTLRRLAAWVGVLSLTLFSYSWWGSETSPLVHMLPVTLGSLCAWICLMVFERRMLRALKREERDPDGDIIDDEFEDEAAEQEADSADEVVDEESPDLEPTDAPTPKADADG